MIVAQDPYVYEVDRKIASTYRISRKSHPLSHVTYFGGLAMHPDFRGKGFGKRIMLEIIESLEQKGIKRLELLVVCDNERSIRFCKSLGFCIVGVFMRYLKRANTGEYLDEIAMATIIG
jgi:putative acetyltransferase